MYKESQLDRKNRKWFADEKSVNSLKRIKVSSGHIRGVYPSEINFSYPITAIVGENGSGKSTYLSLIACGLGCKSRESIILIVTSSRLHRMSTASLVSRFKQIIKQQQE